jgi:hypothetical protein
MRSAQVKERIKAKHPKKVKMISETANRKRIARERHIAVRKAMREQP